MPTATVSSTSSGPSPSPTPSPRRRLPRGSRPAFAVVLALAVLVGADRVVGHLAQARVARRVACTLGAHGPVTAGLHGSVRTVQVLTGDLGTVDVTARDVRRGDLRVDVRATLSGVRAGDAAPLGSGHASTGGGTATATVSYADVLGRLQGRGTGGAGQVVAVSGDGQQLAVTVRTGQVPVPLTVLMDVRADGAGLVATPRAISVAGMQVDAAMARSLLSSRGAATSALDPRRLPLPTLPPGVRLSSVVPAADGLRLGLDLAGGPVTIGGTGCATPATR